MSRYAPREIRHRSAHPPPLGRVEMKETNEPSPEAAAPARRRPPLFHKEGPMSAWARLSLWAVAIAGLRVAQSPDRLPNRRPRCSHDRRPGR